MEDPLMTNLRPQVNQKDHTRFCQSRVKDKTDPTFNAAGRDILNTNTRRKNNRKV